MSPMFSRFLPGFKQNKKSPERKGQSEVLPEPVPAGHIPSGAPPIADDQGGNATDRSIEPPTEPGATAIDKKDIANDDVDEKLPTRLAIAQDRLNNAGEKLKKKLPIDLLASREFEIKVSADINSLVDNIGSALVTLMEQRNIAKSEQSHARSFAMEWARKTIPFIETGLTIANNFIPPPYNLIAPGVVHVLKKAQTMADMAEKVDNTIVDLLLAIQNVGGTGDFSKIYLDEVRIAVIYLSASVIECLTSLIDWVNACVLKMAIMTPDFNDKLNTVYTRSALYSNALQFKVIQERQHNDILKWISPKSDSPITPKPLDEVAGSHSTFINSQDYLNWVGKGHSALICSGQPGVGKSHLVLFALITTFPDASSLIFHRLREDPKLRILYFFFNHSNRNETAEKVIRILLMQVVAQCPRIPSEVTAEYSRYINDPHKMPTTRDKFSILLKTSLEQFSCFPSFILIDAYDEFRNTDEEEAQRTQLRSALSTICLDGLARILITTRPQCRNELRDAFPNSQIAVVNGDLVDVVKYLDNQIQPLRHLHDELKSNIKKTILDANREELWFLLVKLQVKYVLEPKDAGEKRRRLSSLPKKPTDAYCGILERMTSDDLRFACRILGWVLHARRILTMAELQEALAIRIGVTSLNAQDITSAEEIISTCGGFIDYNQGNNLVTFSHETVRPFLEEHDPASLSSYSELCKTCLTYLQLSTFKEPCNMKDLNERLKEFKFGTYAAQFWAVHANQLLKRELELEEQIIETFSSNRRGDSMAQLRTRYYTDQKSLLHVLIENRLSSIFMSPLSIILPYGAMNAPDGKGATPLHYAARNGELEVVKWLIERKADVAAKDFWQRTALHRAAIKGHRDVVALLLGHMDGADVAAKDSKSIFYPGGQTALHYAAENGHADVVALLLTHMDGADVAAKDASQKTALHRAAENGHADAVALLLGHMSKADVAAKDVWQKTALHRAAMNGHRDVVTLLEKWGREHQDH